MEQWQMEMSGWYPEFQALRHRLHREPERSFQEHGTTQLIRELLEPEFGPMFVTPQDIDERVRRLSFTVSEGIHQALYKEETNR